MNVNVDFKGAKLLALATFIIILWLIALFLGLRNAHNGQNVREKVMDWIVSASVKSSIGSSAETILPLMKDKQLQGKKIEETELVYLRGLNYKRLDSGTPLSNDEKTTIRMALGNTWKTKIVLLSEIGLENQTDKWLTLKQDGTAAFVKTPSVWLSVLQMKEGDKINKGLHISWIGFWPYTEEEATKLYKEAFNNGLKVDLWDGTFMVVVETQVWDSSY